MADVMNYIDRLVAELCPDGVDFYPIEELFTTRNGYTPSKSNSSYWENGTVPWFRMEDIREMVESYQKPCSPFMKAL